MKAFVLLAPNTWCIMSSSFPSLQQQLIVDLLDATLQRGNLGEWLSSFRNEQSYYSYDVNRDVLYGMSSHAENIGGSGGQKGRGGGRGGGRLEDQRSRLGYTRAPNKSDPTLTLVAPCWMAASKSDDMPMDSSRDGGSNEDDDEDDDEEDK